MVGSRMLSAVAGDIPLRNNCAIATAQIVLIFLTALEFATPADAARVIGGKVPSADCLAEFEIEASGTDTEIRCTDCDPACDKDAVASPNGSCTFAIALCLNQ